MDIVVKLPDKDYSVMLTKIMLACYGCEIIELPKGHGRLIDADKLDRIMYHKAFETDSDMQKWDSGCWIRYKMFENSMEEMSAIIEADAESEGKNADSGD